MTTVFEQAVEAAVAVLWPATEWNGEESTCRSAVEAALRAALPIVGEDLAKAVETKATRMWGDRFDIDDITSALRSRLSEIMEG